MATALQIVCAVFILAAAVLFICRNRTKKTGESKGLLVLTVFQIILCGWFFALCVSDILDIKVSFSLERLVVNIFYAIAFLAISVYALFNNRKQRPAYFKGVLWAYIVLIAVQCFAFPYGTENLWLRVVEALEGAAVFGMLIALLFRMEDESFCRKCLMIAIILELLIAIENVIVPFATITDDIEIIDIPLNYAALFMRPVLFASLALAYHARLIRCGKAAADAQSGEKD